MGATNRFSEAAWELQMAFLKPPEECTQFPGGFRKAICSSHAALEQLLALQQEGLGNICENSKAFCKR
jgi:hypothetical protein